MRSPPGEGDRAQYTAGRGRLSKRAGGEPPEQVAGGGALGGRELDAGEAGLRVAGERGLEVAAGRVSVASRGVRAAGEVAVARVRGIGADGGVEPRERAR